MHVYEVYELTVAFLKQANTKGENSTRRNCSGMVKAWSGNVDRYLCYIDIYITYISMFSHCQRIYLYGIFSMFYSKTQSWILCKMTFPLASFQCLFHLLEKKYRRSSATSWLHLQTFILKSGFDHTSFWLPWCLESPIRNHVFKHQVCVVLREWIKD